MENIEKEAEESEAVAKWKSLEKVNVLLRKDQVDFLSQMTKAIMRSREAGEDKERITSNTIIRCIIDLMISNAKRFSLDDVSDEQSLLERMHSVFLNQNGCLSFEEAELVAIKQMLHFGDYFISAAVNVSSCVKSLDDFVKRWNSTDYYKNIVGKSLSDSAENGIVLGKRSIIAMLENLISYETPNIQFFMDSCMREVINEKIENQLRFTKT